MLAGGGLDLGGGAPSNLGKVNGAAGSSAPYRLMVKACLLTRLAIHQLSPTLIHLASRRISRSIRSAVSARTSSSSRRWSPCLSYTLRCLNASKLRLPAVCSSTVRLVPERRCWRARSPRAAAVKVARSVRTRDRVLELQSGRADRLCTAPQPSSCARVPTACRNGSERRNVNSDCSLTRPGRASRRSSSSTRLMVRFFFSWRLLAPGDRADSAAIVQVSRRSAVASRSRFTPRSSRPCSPLWTEWTDEDKSSSSVRRIDRTRSTPPCAGPGGSTESFTSRCRTSTLVERSSTSIRRAGTRRWKTCSRTSSPS